MFNRIIQSFAFFLILITLISCGGGDKETEKIINNICEGITLNQYAGNWKGNYNGSGVNEHVNNTLSGSWTVIATESGSVSGSTSGTITNPDADQAENFEYAITGNVTEQGEMRLTAKSDSGEEVIEWIVFINCSDMSLTGTWENKLVPYSGNVDGQKYTNLKPIANAGDDNTATIGSIVALDGSASQDPENEVVSYLWVLETKPEGSVAALSDSTITNPVFTADLAGVYTINLLVNDGNLDSVAKTVTITVSAEDASPGVLDNSPPIAKANVISNEALIAGNVIQLDGSDSQDPEDQTISYLWSLIAKPDSSSATLSDPIIVNPVFTADVEGTYTINLIVNDGALDSITETITVTVAARTPVITNNSAPIANAGEDETIQTQVVYELDGSNSSDADNNPLSFQWMLVSKPTASNVVILNSTSVNPTFTPDVDGTYVLSLIVSDDTFSSAQSTITLIAQSPNEPPIAVAGTNQEVDTLTLVTLDGGASSDLEGADLSFTWVLSSKPTGSNVSLNNAMSVNPSFTPDLIGTYKIELTVNDGVFDSEISEVLVIAVETNIAPIADPGSDKKIELGQLIQLDGSASSDANDDNLTYSWSLLTAPPQSVAFLVDDSSQRPTLTPDLVGEYVLTLVVNDGTVDSEAVNLIITVLSAVDKIVIASGIANLDLSTNKVSLGVTYTIDPSEFPLGSLGSFDVTIKNNQLTISDALGNSTTFERRSGKIDQAIGIWQQPDNFSGFAFQLDFREDNSFLASVVAVEHIKLNFIENFTIAGNPLVNSITVNQSGNFVLDNNPDSSFSEFDDTFQQLNEVLPGDGICCTQQQIKYDDAGNLFVLTAGKLVKYNTDLTIVASVTVAAGNAFFDIDSAGNIFAVDQDENAENTIYKFDNDLIYISEKNIGNTAGFNDGGYSYSVDYIAVDRNNNVAISLDVKDDLSSGGKEEGLDTVLVFNNNLADLAIVGNKEQLLNGPTGITFDTDNNMYIASRWHANIVILDNSYIPIGFTNPDDLEGNAEGQLNQPTDILIHNNKLYVVDSFNLRIAVFATVANSSLYTRPLPPPLININKQATGIYSYTEVTPTKGMIEASFSNSDFLTGCGPQVATETIAVNFNSDDLIVLDILGILWHRVEGTPGEIIGTWKASADHIVDLTLTLGSDNSISVTGDLSCSFVI